MKSLADLQEEIHKTAEAKGWWNQEQRNFGMILALIHSEISEALEAWREHKKPWYLDGDKPEGWGIELADATIRILDLCEANMLNLQDMIEAKMKYNETRPYRHGGKRA